MSASGAANSANAQAGGGPAIALSCLAPGTSGSDSFLYIPDLSPDGSNPIPIPPGLKVEQRG